MTADFAAPALQVCLLTLGCTLIHAARAHAALMTRLLAGAAVVLAVLVMLAVSLAVCPGDDMSLDGLTFYDAL